MKIWQLVISIVNRRSLSQLKVLKFKMPRNVEVKARVDDIDLLAKTASELCQFEGTVIDQNDTFFVTEKGRLKLRVFKDGQGELIFYDRPDCEGPKLSDFSKAPISDPDSLRTVLTQALGSRGQVKKRRLLFMYQQTRIHVDKVEGLGNFMELEVQLRDEQTIEEGTQIAENLLEKLGIPKSNLISGAYLDWLNKT